MKIENMYANCLEWLGYSEKRNMLTMCVDDVVEAFREAADRIPDEKIYQAVASEIAENGSYSAQCAMRFERTEDGFKYFLGQSGRINGKVEMEKLNGAVNFLEEYLHAEYGRDATVEEFLWILPNCDVFLDIILYPTEQEIEEYKRNRKDEHPCLVVDENSAPIVKELESSYEVSTDACDDDSHDIRMSILFYL